MAKITLRGARVSAGLTQEEMAEKMGKSRNTIHKLENRKNKRPVSAPDLNMWAQITGFSVDDIEC